MGGDEGKPHPQASKRSYQEVATVIALRLPQNLHLPRGQPPVKGGPSTPPRIGGPVGTKKGRTRKGCSTAQRATKKVATVIAQRIPQNLHLPRTLPVNGRAEHGPALGRSERKREKPRQAQRVHRAARMVATVIALKIPQNLHLSRGKLTPVKRGPSTTPPRRGGRSERKRENPRGLLNR